MSSKTELPPCECGSTDSSIGYESPQGYWVECGDCGYQTDKSHPQEIVIALWSKRAAPVVERQLNPEFRGGAVGVPRDLLESICSYEWRGDLAASNAQQLRGILDGRITGWQPPELAELQATIEQLTAENADMQNRLAEACKFIDNPYDKEKLQALIAECRYGVSGKGPAIEVANDLLNDCCDNLESLLKDNERLKGGQGEPVDAILLENCEEVIVQDYGRGYFATDDCVAQLYTSQPAPVSAPEDALRLLQEASGVLQAFSTVSQTARAVDADISKYLDKVKELNQ